MTSSENTGRRGIVITGAGTGIGRATARAFADRGDLVLAVGRTETTLKEAAQGRSDIHVLAVDITDPDAPGQIVDAALRKIGRIDVLVNNAAVACFDPIDKLTEATVRRQVATNLVAPVLLTQQALDALAASGGVVVNVSSSGALGLRAMPNSSVYAATKVGLDSLTRTWAIELASRGIRVVSIAPGLINTGVGVRAGMPQQVYDDFLDTMKSQVPAGRIGTPEDIADWIVRLSDSESAYVNGALLAVDGGLSLT